MILQNKNVDRKLSRSEITEIGGLIYLADKLTRSFLSDERYLAYKDSVIDGIGVPKSQAA
jgi:hypothetical protein